MRAMLKSRPLIKILLDENRYVPFGEHFIIKMGMENTDVGKGMEYCEEHMC